MLMADSADSLSDDGFRLSSASSPLLESPRPGSKGLPPPSEAPPARASAVASRLRALTSASEGRLEPRRTADLARVHRLAESRREPARDPVLSPRPAAPPLADLLKMQSEGSLVPLPPSCDALRVCLSLEGAPRCRRAAGQTQRQPHAKVEYLNRARADCVALQAFCEAAAMGFSCVALGLGMEVLAELDLCAGADRGVRGVRVGPPPLHRGKPDGLQAALHPDLDLDLDLAALPDHVFALVPCVRLRGEASGGTVRCCVFAHAEHSDLPPAPSQPSLRPAPRTEGFDEADFSSGEEGPAEGAAAGDWAVAASASHLRAARPCSSDAAWAPLVVFRRRGGEGWALKLLGDAAVEGADKAALLSALLTRLLAAAVFPFCVVHIEHCVDCESHARFSRHVPGSYQRRAAALRSHLRRQLPPLLLYCNHASVAEPPKLGAFEMSVLPYAAREPVLLFSKRAQGEFPVPRRIVRALSGLLLPQAVEFSPAKELKVRLIDSSSRRPMRGLAVEVLRVEVCVRWQDLGDERGDEASPLLCAPTRDRPSKVARPLSSAGSDVLQGRRDVRHRRDSALRSPGDEGVPVDPRAGDSAGASVTLVSVARAESDGRGLVLVRITQAGAYVVRICHEQSPVAVLPFTGPALHVHARAPPELLAIVDVHPAAGALAVSIVCPSFAYRQFVWRTGALVSLRRLRDGHRVSVFLPFLRRRKRSDGAVEVRVECRLPMGAYFSEVDGALVSVSGDASELRYDSMPRLARCHARTLRRAVRLLQEAFLRRARRVLTAEEAKALAVITRLVCRRPVLEHVRRALRLRAERLLLAGHTLVKFQALVRGHTQRLSVMFALSLTTSLLEHVRSVLRVRHRSATTVQRIVRGFLWRLLRMDQKRRGKASAVIARLVRVRCCCFVRRATERLRRGIETHAMRKEEALARAVLGLEAEAAKTLRAEERLKVERLLQVEYLRYYLRS